MKLLLATPWLYPQGGGLERYAASVAHELARAGHEVTLLGHADAPVRQSLAGVERIGIAPARRFSNTPLSLAIWREAKTLGARADVVNVHTPVPGTAELVALAARRAKRPYVVTYHAGALDAPPGLLRLAAKLHAAMGERALLRRAAARIAVSPYVAKHVYGRLASAIIPPGVDTTRFAPRGEPVRGRILFVGPVSRAYAWKGLAVLAEAFEALSRRLPEAHLRIVGEGDLVESYRARFSGRAATLVGRLDDAGLVREYCRASVVVLPSVTPAESFGMCLAEANACGRPVVGSAIGGIPDLVRHEENGLLVAPKDAEALADAIERVLLDRGLARRLGETGRARVAKEHGWSAIGEATARVLEGAAR